MESQELNEEEIDLILMATQRSLGGVLSAMRSRRTKRYASDTTATWDLLKGDP